MSEAWDSVVTKCSTNKSSSNTPTWVMMPAPSSRSLSRTTMVRSTASRRARNSAWETMCWRVRPFSRNSARRRFCASMRVEPRMAFGSSMCSGSSACSSRFAPAPRPRDAPRRPRRRPSGFPEPRSGPECSRLSAAESAASSLSSLAESSAENSSSAASKADANAAASSCCGAMKMGAKS